MLMAEYKDDNRIAVSASGSFSDRHMELMALICSMSDEVVKIGMGFDDFLIATMIMTKKLRKNSTSVDMSKLSSIMDTDDFFDTDLLG